MFAPAPCGTITIKSDSFFGARLSKPKSSGQKPERNEDGGRPYGKRLDLIAGLEIFATKSRAITHATGEALERGVA